MPWIDRLWVKNPILSRLRPAHYSPMVDFAIKRQEERLRDPEVKSSANDRDFLSRFIESMEKDPSIPKW